MKTIHTDDIIIKLKELILYSCVNISTDCEKALQKAALNETSDQAKFALQVIQQNIKAAKENSLPACQDTGMAVIFLEIGQDVKIEGMLINDAINQAVRQAYKQGCFRMSVLDPLTRINTKDNTPAIIHTKIIEGDNINIGFIAKGFGSENMSRLFMLKPSQGLQGVKDCILQSVIEAGGNPCPPIIVGVGIGGTADKSAEIAKHSLFRDIGSKNADEELDKLENELLNSINKSNIGAQGFKGNNTALAVFIEKYPTHLAALPVSVNIQCHSVRKGWIKL